DLPIGCAELRKAQKGSVVGCAEDGARCARFRHCAAAATGVSVAAGHAPPPGRFSSARESRMALAPPLAIVPDRRPQNPNFGSGPCAKRPGFLLDALAPAMLGRSHRARKPKARLEEVIARSRAILGL